MERITEGHTARLQCTMRNVAVTHIDVHWSRERPGRRSEWILVHYSWNYVQRYLAYYTWNHKQWYSGLKTRFQSSRNSSRNNFILTITNVQPSDTGVYYCSIWGRISGGGSRLIVDSTSGLALLQSPILKCVTEGHTAQLQCTMRNATVTHTDVHWYRQEPDSHMKLLLTHERNGYIQWISGFIDRIQPSRNSSSNSFILTITNVQSSDTGVYYCSAWGNVPGGGSHLIVNSITGLALLQSPRLEHATEGQTAQLQCTMRNAAVIHIDVHWYWLSLNQIMKQILTHPRSGSTQWSPGFTERFQPSRDSSHNSFILTITNVQPSDTGVYYCSVQGRIYGRGILLNITSENVPVLLQSPSLERATEGHSAQLQCTMRKAAVTHTDVHWHREQPGNSMEWILTDDVRNITQWSPGFIERFQSSRDPSNNSFILTITNVQPSDTGVYYCNVWGDISGNGSQLTVMDPLADPVLIQYPVASKVPEGETVEFQCAMYNASVNDTDVHWHYQRPGSNREWVISQFVNGTLAKAQSFHDRVHVSRNVSRNSYILRLVNVTVNDTAVFRCSVWSYVDGTGSQLDVTEDSSYGSPRTSKHSLFIGTILGFAIMICIVLLTFLLQKKKLCSSVKDST
ncbi:immunoglobulin superfamily member 3-like [Stegostoma tigrinum]|uniref:immunoglobulin superfamily member 3-like n=1 Tax=Stegostoma tigrinum TaxID=3053191 RepID=UPI0028702691|nr:immunoglobulin superfamily member 3-like [Stegostoma tigrinum]XP_059504818.1 immunoglobulin superfamily member 3-like [Stegostoma tigrinum]